MPLWPQSAAPTGAKEAEEHGRSRRCTQGGARLRRCLPWAGMLRAFSASAASRPGMPGARQAPPADIWRRRGLKARTTVVTGARLGPPVALWLNYQWLTDYQKRSLFSDISREVSAHGIILLSLSFFIGTTTNYLRLNPQTHIHPCLPTFTPCIGQVVPRDNTSPKIRQEYNHEHPPPLIYPH